MKAFVSYVVQDNAGHKHLSEVVNIDTPPYTFNADPPVTQVMEWAEKKRTELKKGEELVVVNVLKL
ncbi:MAG: hypothetical protein EPO28_12235 [Saprospiraceae bacterium]|nr:MAG: hypothetical protein EPO28_12235 [Saprospiraceae bacterium]